MGQLIDGFNEFRKERHDNAGKCEACSRRFREFCEIQRPNAHGHRFDWTVKAVKHVIAVKRNETEEEFQTYLDQHDIGDNDLLARITKVGNRIVLLDHHIINAEHDCPHFSLNSAAETSFFEDVIDYAKTLKFTFK